MFMCEHAAGEPCSHLERNGDRLGTLPCSRVSMLRKACSHLALNGGRLELDAAQHRGRAHIDACIDFVAHEFLQSTAMKAAGALRLQCKQMLGGPRGLSSKIAGLAITAEVKGLRQPETEQASRPCAPPSQ